MIDSSDTSSKKRLQRHTVLLIILGVLALYAGVAFSGVFKSDPSVAFFRCVAVILLFFLGWHLLRGAYSGIRLSLPSSRKRPVAILGWVLTIICALSYSLIISGAGALCAHTFDLTETYRQMVWVFWGATILLTLALVRGAAAIADICTKKAGRWGSVFCVALFVTSFVVIFLYLVRDETPIEGDYSVLDLPVPERDAEATHKLLMTYQRGQKSTIPPAPWDYWEDATGALTHAATIEKGWDLIAEARKVIETLDSYDAIGDLTIPTIEAKSINFVAYRNIAQTYWAIAVLRGQQKRHAEGLEELIQLQSVFRKTIPYSRSLVRRMICVAILRGNIHQVHRLVKVSPESVLTDRVLNELRPLPAEDLSLRNSIIAEYLLQKDFCEDFSLNYSQIDFFDRSTGKTTGLTATIFDRVLTPLLYNRNATIRLLRQIQDDAMKEIRAAKSGAEPDESLVDGLLAGPRIKNVMGRFLLSISIPSYYKAEQTSVKLQAASEMLFVELQNRRGEEVSISDPFTGTPYRIDRETGNAVCAGFDGKFLTDDDFSLDDDTW